jgi:hypothetical protein
MDLSDSLDCLQDSLTGYVPKPQGAILSASHKQLFGDKSASVYPVLVTSKDFQNFVALQIN